MASSEVSCAGCNQKLSGQILEALDKKWHAAHFVCTKCQASLVTSSFFENNGAPYCEKCQAEFFSPQCNKCKQPITGKSMLALDKSWHPEHFACQSCAVLFDEKSSFHEKDGQPYCKKCFQVSQGLQCAGCNLMMDDSYLTALDKKWHLHCFVCQICKQPFKETSFYEVEGLPYCEKDYIAKEGRFCEVCKELIQGPCVSALDRLYHPQHFQCCQCSKQLPNTEFYEDHGKPMCKECAL